MGAGDTSELVAQHLVQQGVSSLNVANRTLQRATELAQRVGAEAHSLSQLGELLPNADIVVSSTASTLPIIGKGRVEKALKQRRHKPILLIDLARWSHFCSCSELHSRPGVPLRQQERATRA